MLEEFSWNEVGNNLFFRYHHHGSYHKIGVFHSFGIPLDFEMTQDFTNGGIHLQVGESHS